MGMLDCLTINVKERKHGGEWKDFFEVNRVRARRFKVRLDLDFMYS